MAEEALLDERLQRVELGLAHLLGCLDRAAAGEDGEAGEEALLSAAEQVVRPRDRRAQGALPLGEVARASAQEREPLLEPISSAAGEQHLDARRGELDRERQVVEPAADRRDLAVRRELDAGRP